MVKSKTRKKQKHGKKPHGLKRKEIGLGDNHLKNKKMNDEKQLNDEEQMNDKDKREYFYKLWEHHSNLLWNKIQNVFVIMAAFYTAWFVLFGKMLKCNHDNDRLLYFILIMGMICLVLLICIYFKQLMSRDTEQQKRIETELKIIFQPVKNNSETPENKRGRIIIQKMMNLCIISCLCLFLIAVISFVRISLDNSVCVLLLKKL